MTMKKRASGATKFTPDTLTVLYNSLRRGNFRVTACKQANLTPRQFSVWMKDPRPEYVEFQKTVIEIEAEVESRAVNKILEAGEKDAKWYAFWLERKCPHWNNAVHRWELQVLQRQLKQLKGIIDDLQKTNTGGLEINTDCLNPVPYPHLAIPNSN